MEKEKVKRKVKQSKVQNNQPVEEKLILRLPKPKYQARESKNGWVNYVKEFSSDNKVRYKDALKLARKTYKKPK